MISATRPSLLSLNNDLGLPSDPLPLPCAAELLLERRAAARRGSRFTALPGRLDAGIDARWGSRPHRLKIRLGRWVAARLGRKPQPVYPLSPVNGAVKGIIVGLLLEAIAVGAIAAFVISRKVY